jgi:hypothetical protein
VQLRRGPVTGGSTRSAANAPAVAPRKRWPRILDPWTLNLTSQCFLFSCGVAGGARARSGRSGNTRQWPRATGRGTPICGPTGVAAHDGFRGRPPGHGPSETGIRRYRSTVARALIMPIPRRCLLSCPATTVSSTSAALCSSSPVCWEGVGGMRAMACPGFVDGFPRDPMRKVIR